MEPINKTILIVEDNKEVLILNRKVLNRKGFQVLTAQTIAEARVCLKAHQVHLIILDILLPDGSGLDFCAEIREKTSAPILMLSGLRSNQDIVGGLQIGGDDYVTKPYRVEELLARVNSLLRREMRHERQMEKQAPRRIIAFGSLKLDTESGRASMNELDVGLTPKEFALLLLLVKNEGEMVPSKEIYEKVWGSTPNDDVRTVWTHISKLRNKLGVDADSHINISAERRKGYIFTFIK